MMSVTQPLTEAWNRTVHICIKTFRLQKWVALTFAAWLVGLGDASLNVHTRLSSSNRVKLPDLTGVVDALEQHLWITLAAMAAVTVVLLAIATAGAWVKSRAEFMFIDNLAHNRGWIEEPWRGFRAEAWSLFKVRVLMGGVLFVALGLVAGGLIAAWKTHQLELGGWVALAITPPLMVVSLSLWGMAEFLLEQLLVPIMYVRRVTAREAWTILRGLTREGRSGAMVTYFVMTWVITLAAGTVASFASTATCCVAALPFLSTAILLPILVYLRCYSLAFVEQLGPEYRIFNDPTFGGPDAGSAPPPAGATPEA